MKITEKQLKDIAMAGYDGISGWAKAVIGEAIFVNGGYYSELIYEDTSLVYIEIKDDDFIWIDTSEAKFNTLSAINELKRIKNESKTTKKNTKKITT